MFIVCNYQDNPLKGLQQVVWFYNKCFLVITLINKLFDKLLYGSTKKLNNQKTKQLGQNPTNDTLTINDIVTGLFDIFKLNTTIDFPSLNWLLFLCTLIVFIMILMGLFLYSSIFSLDRLKEIKTLHFKVKLDKVLYEMLWVLKFIICVNSFIGLLFLLIKLLLWCFPNHYTAVGCLLFVINYTPNQLPLFFIFFIILQTIKFYNLTCKRIELYIYTQLPIIEFNGIKFDEVVYKKILLITFLVLFCLLALPPLILPTVLYTQQSISFGVLNMIFIITLIILVLIFYGVFLIIIPAIMKLLLQKYLKKKINISNIHLTVLFFLPLVIFIILLLNVKR